MTAKSKRFLKEGSDEPLVSRISERDPMNKWRVRKVANAAAQARQLGLLDCSLML